MYWQLHNMLRLALSALRLGAWGQELGRAITLPSECYSRRLLSGFVYL